MVLPRSAPEQIFVSQVIDGVEHRHTIELARPAALITEMDIFGSAMRLQIHLADRSCLLVKIVCKDTPSVSLQVADQDIRIMVEGAFAYCSGLPSSMSLKELAATDEAEITRK